MEMTQGQTSADLRKKAEKAFEELCVAHAYWEDGEPNEVVFPIFVGFVEAVAEFEKEASGFPGIWTSPTLPRLWEAIASAEKADDFDDRWEECERLATALYHVQEALEE